jgi:aspartyl-tRNA(Asn)/glutamyl-tRNA(Gln) amidotransferase subunit B
MAKEQLMSYEDAIERFEVVIGLEVHVELNTVSKMFCGCANNFGSEPNTNVCPTCLGLPGSLPAVNRKAVESSIAIGLALDCQIASNGRFARKNYFYPDLAKNFQTSQFDEPIAFEGEISIELETGEVFMVPIERAH